MFSRLTRFAILPVAAAGALLVSAAVNTGPAEAGGKRYGDAHAGKYKYIYGQKNARSNRAYTWRNRRDRAIFSSDVDLGAPGGTKRYFELLSEETR